MLKQFIHDRVQLGFNPLPFERQRGLAIKHFKNEKLSGLVIAARAEQICYIARPDRSQ